MTLNWCCALQDTLQTGAEQVAELFKSPVTGLGFASFGFDRLVRFLYCFRNGMESFSAPAKTLGDGLERCNLRICLGSHTRNSEIVGLGGGTGNCIISIPPYRSFLPSALAA
jgi:hypothetical protein